MTLDEFSKVVSEASKNAHLFVADGYGFKQVRSVSLRMDDDGTLSVLMHPNHMPDRVTTEDAKTLALQLKMIRELLVKEPQLKQDFDDFDGFFVHWNEIIDALAEAGEEYQQYSISPMELLQQLIDERNELKAKLDSQDSTNSATP